MKPEKPVSRERIEHIQYSILNIQSFTKGYSLDEWGELSKETEPQPTAEAVAVEKSDGKVEMEKIQNTDIKKEDIPF